jgi:uroporphyrinogen decarboxylase
MRQAGRYMEAYRELRARFSFEKLCSDPALAFEVSLQPHRAFDVDAVIVFSDILIPLEAMGAPLAFTDEGPRFAEPIRDAKAAGRLHPIDPARDTPAILETIGRLAAELAGRKPVLGFAGAPFTLAAYLIEGQVGGRGIEATLRMLYREPELLKRLLDLLTEMTIDYLGAQIDAGASAVQLFDTWAGRLAEQEYRGFALPCQQRIFAALSRRSGKRAPSILFVRDGPHLVEAMAESGAGALSLDWRVPLSRARAVVGPRIALQGNLDPAALFSTPDGVRRRTEEILADRRGDPAFIFNLGHGVLPETPVESVRVLVDTVRQWKD